VTFGAVAATPHDLFRIASLGSAQVAAADVVPWYSGTVHFSGTDNTATLPSNYTFTASDKGVHTFTGLVLRMKGKQKITITS
jgi:hypothetical protein